MNFHISEAFDGKRKEESAEHKLLVKPDVITTMRKRNHHEANIMRSLLCWLPPHSFTFFTTIGDYYRHYYSLSYLQQSYWHVNYTRNSSLLLARFHRPSLIIVFYKGINNNIFFSSYKFTYNRRKRGKINFLLNKAVIT